MTVNIYCKQVCNPLKYITIQNHTLLKKSVEPKATKVRPPYREQCVLQHRCYLHGTPSRIYITPSTSGECW